MATQREMQQALRAKQARTQQQMQQDLQAEQMVVPLPDDAVGPNIPNTPVASNAPAIPKYENSALYDAAMSAPASLYKNTLQPFEHPIDMAKGIGGMIQGGYHKIFDDDVNPDGSPAIPHTSEALLDSVWEETKKPYTSWENAEKTFREDPFRFLSDASTALYGAGAVPRIAGKASGVSKLSSAGKSIQNLGQAVDPMSIGANAIRSGFIDPAKKATNAIRNYQSAAKWPTTMPPDIRDAITQTAIDNNLPLSVDSVYKLQNQIKDMSKPIDSAIDAVTDAGVTIPLYELARELSPLRKEMGAFTVKGRQNAKKLRELSKKFFQHWEDKGVTEITPTMLQNFKKNAYKEIDWDKTVGSGGYTENAFNMALASAAKNKLEVLVPGIADQNAQLGKLLELQPSFERAMGRIGNRYKSPFMAYGDIGGAGIGGGALGAFASSAVGGFDPMITSGAAALGAGVIGHQKYLEHPLIASRNAIKNVGKLPMNAMEQMMSPRPLPFWASQLSSAEDRSTP